MEENFDAEWTLVKDTIKEVSTSAQKAAAFVSGDKKPLNCRTQ